MLALDHQLFVAKDIPRLCAIRMPLKIVSSVQFAPTFAQPLEATRIGEDHPAVPVFRVHGSIGCLQHRVRIEAILLAAGLRCCGNEVIKAFAKLIAAPQGQSAPFHIEEIAREGRIAFDLGALPALFRVLEAVSDLFA